jgi:hypothetical protein
LRIEGFRDPSGDRFEQLFVPGIWLAHSSFHCNMAAGGTQDFGQ